MTTGTVVACPLVARWTTKLVCVVPGGSVRVKSPLAPVWLPASMSALLAAPKRRLRSVLVGSAALVPALIVTRSRPGPSGADATATGGRGVQAAEGTDAEWPAVGAGLGAVGLVPP